MNAANKRISFDSECIMTRLQNQHVNTEVVPQKSNREHLIRYNTAITWKKLRVIDIMYYTILWYL